ncbi:hypothetical protein DOY81_015759 [Sarcophaga bullata]|nr:hypothetical protein DOY81_015759 [Sarcophaga bullata]
MEQQPLHQHQSTAQQQSRSLKNNSAMVTEELYAPLSPCPIPDISDDELVSISVRDLNRTLKCVA